MRIRIRFQIRIPNTGKNMVAEKVFVNCYNFNPFTEVKKKVILKVSYKIIRSRNTGLERPC
jgi:hypothetical protein